jgi:hypothetical protein
MVESGAQTPRTIVTVSADRVELNSSGTHPTRVLRIAPR